GGRGVRGRGGLGEVAADEDAAHDVEAALRLPHPRLPFERADVVVGGLLVAALQFELLAPVVELVRRRRARGEGEEEDEGRGEERAHGREGGGERSASYQACTPARVRAFTRRGRGRGGAGRPGRSGGSSAP